MHVYSWLFGIIRKEIISENRSLSQNISVFEVLTSTGVLMTSTL